MRINGFIAFICLPVMVLCITGCQGQTRHNQPSEPLCLSSCDRAQIMQAAETVLGEKRFTIEKFDINNGYILTRPMRGSQFFEPWRGDNADSVSIGMSSIHSLQRIVEVELLEGSDGWCVDCYAHLRKLSMVEDRYVSMADSRTLYTNSNSSIMKLTPNPDAEIEWIEMGRDSALENDILESINDILSTSDVAVLR